MQRNGGSRDASLFGNTGYQSQADMNYRYTRKTTIGAYYSHTNYVYTHRVQPGELEYRSGGIYSYALEPIDSDPAARRCDAHGERGTAIIAIDPADCDIPGSERRHDRCLQPETHSDISAEVVRDFGRNRSLSFAYVRGISPGNGFVADFRAGELFRQFFRSLSGSIG